MLKRLMIACVSLASLEPACAAAPEPGPLAIAVIEQWLLPRNDALAEAAGAQSDAWRAACADGEYAQDLAALEERYQAAADAWAAVEHVTTGPVSLSLRPERIFFFPDKRNAVAKALAELESKAKAGDLTEQAFRAGSVAGQGFPALERLLYEAPDGEPAARCRVGVAIAGNLAALTRQIRDEWRSDAGPLAKLKAGQGDPVHFADPGQAAARLLTDLAGGIQRDVDVKLLPVLGAGVDTARPRAAEGWRSNRTARTLRASIASLSAMAAIFARAAPAQIAAGDAMAFAAAQAAVAKLPDDVGEAAADPKRRKAVEQAVAALKVAQANVVKDVAPAIGVPLGFNALDGD